MKFWPFRRPAPRLEISIDDDSLDRAIRAGVQIPFEWFLQQSPEVQLTIAIRRDRWLEDQHLAVAFAILDPERTMLSLAAEDGDEDAEADLTRLNGLALAKAMGEHAAREGSGTPPRSTPLSMGGMGKRRQAADDKAEAGRRKPSFFGAAENIE